MEFTKRLREGVRAGRITCSIRIWLRPKVKAGGRYRMGDGEIEVDAIDPIELADITPSLARESGFASVIDLLKTAKHGRGTNIYLVRFHYLPARQSRDAGRKVAARSTATGGPRKKPNADRQRKRIASMLAHLPEAATVASHGHLQLLVRKKCFGYFLDDHHGDGRIALSLKSSPDIRDLLEQMAPREFHLPKYVGNKGWIGLWLDGKAVNWGAVELALREAYLLAAPKALARRLPRQGDQGAIK
jgi:hypothetical protein